jgi:hypothetical protein
MAEKEKTLEMRVAELEDKLSKLHVTEDEMKAYQKVAGLMGAQAAPAAGTTASPSIIACIVRTCIIRTCIINTCICINECTCGPCLQGGGGGIGGSGFGGLGT